MRSLTRTPATVHPLTEAADSLADQSRSWDEYALRQRLVSVHAAADQFRADLSTQFPADLIPRATYQAVAEAADALAEGLAHLDAVHHLGAHRRHDVAEDAAACVYRDDAEAVHGYAHNAIHRRRRRARMTAAPVQVHHGVTL